eukprot:snap_masked-scaffold_2-processed-gene-5.20-mRNA-1 protein AED:1.00 eAED:1.00 QI:0/0/0/0/1/1/2/0/73
MKQKVLTFMGGRLCSAFIIKVDRVLRIAHVALAKLDQSYVRIFYAEPKTTKSLEHGNNLIHSINMYILSNQYS